MKKLLAVLLALLMVLTLAGCQQEEETVEPEKEQYIDFNKKDCYKVAYLVNGNLGDKSFFDSAEAGLESLVADGKIELKTVEMGATEADQAKWLQNLYDYSEDGTYDFIIVGTYQMPDYLKEVAEKYPTQKYIIFDDTTYSGEQKNVLNISYKQNELGYVVGVYAAAMTVSGIEGTNADKVVGFIGGVDSPVINDFLYGFLEGAKATVEDIKVDTRYVGNYYETSKGKELGVSMINDSNCDIIWGVGGSAGNGGAEALLDAKTGWYIGVDSDQELTFNADLAAITLTSGLKNVGNSLIWVIDQFNQRKGMAIWGTQVDLGLAKGGVGIVTDKNYATYTPQDVQDKVAAALAGVQDGSITVSSALTDGGNDAAIALRDSMQPAAK